MSTNNRPAWAVKVIEWCKVNPLTQAELAEELGMTRSYFHKRMAGQGTPSKEMLDRLARIMERNTTTPEINLTKGDDE